jgi:hypothetical protein
LHGSSNALTDLRNVATNFTGHSWLKDAQCFQRFAASSDFNCDFHCASPLPVLGYAMTNTASW